MDIDDRVSIKFNEWIPPRYDVNVRGKHGTIVDILPDERCVVELDADVGSIILASRGKLGHCVILSTFYLRKLKTKIPNSKRRVKTIKHIGDRLTLGTMGDKNKIILKNKSNTEMPINASIIVRGGMKRNIFVVYKIEE